MNQMSVGVASPFSDLAGSLPRTDEERLLFYAELVVANTSQLLADLTSPKYTFLSFSEKSRNEVRQKSSLLHSINETFSNLVKTHNEINILWKEHLELSTQKVKDVSEESRIIMRSSVTEVSTSAKAKDNEHISLSNTSVNNGNVIDNTKLHSEEVVSNEKNEIKKRKDSSGDSESDKDYYDNIVNECNSECAVRLHDAEQMLAAEESALQDVSKEVSGLTAEIDKYREECEAMSLNVQQLKHHIDEAEYIYYKAQLEWHVNHLYDEELKERHNITNECECIIQHALQEHLEKELELTEVYLNNVRSNVVNIRGELQERRRRHEVELATYQIAYKEEQANVQNLKDEITTLRQRQHSLEYVAKEQQIAESKANSLVRAFRYALSPSQSTQVIPVPLHNAEANRSCVQKLSAEVEKEIERDHHEVSVLAARVSAMERQRHEVAGVLIQSKSLLEEHLTDFITVKGVVERVQAILAPGIHLDSAALSE